MGNNQSCLSKHYVEFGRRQGIRISDVPGLIGSSIGLCEYLFIRQRGYFIDGTDEPVERQLCAHRYEYHIASVKNANQILPTEYIAGEQDPFCRQILPLRVGARHKMRSNPAA